MQTFRQVLALIFCSAIFSGYNPVFAETAETKHHAQHSGEWPGVYNGFTPCADCNGVKTSLALNTNNTYILITQYIGKSLREFTEKGKFATNENNKIVLTSRDGSTTRQYLVGENMLIQLDSNGNRIAGKNADGYILRRNDVTAKAPKHLH